VSKALRAPANLHRWHTTLESIVRFTEDQLQILDESFERQRHEPGARREYESKRAGTERFRSVLLDYLASAETLVDAERKAKIPAGLVADRDNHAHRVLELERAIRAHRKAVRQDLQEDEKPEPYETALWAMLDE
jgi:hypothetical protein